MKELRGHFRSAKSEVNNQRCIFFVFNNRRRKKLLIQRKFHLQLFNVENISNWKNSKDWRAPLFPAVALENAPHFSLCSFHGEKWLEKLIFPPKWNVNFVEDDVADIAVKLNFEKSIEIQSISIDIQFFTWKLKWIFLNWWLVMSFINFKFNQVELINLIDGLSWLVM